MLIKLGNFEIYIYLRLNTSETSTSTNCRLDEFRDWFKTMRKVDLAG